MDSKILPYRLANDVHYNAIEDILNSIGSLQLNQVIPLDLQNVDDSALPHLAQQLGCAWWQYEPNPTVLRKLLQNWISLYQKKAGTLDGYKLFANLAGAEIIRAHLPQDQFFMSSDLTYEEQQRWLDAHDQFRIYEFKDLSGVRGYEAYLNLCYFSNELTEENVDPWQSETGYNQLDVILEGGYWYEAQNDGTSDTDEPTWGGETVIDNDITWKRRAINYNDDGKAHGVYLNDDYSEQKYVTFYSATTGEETERTNHWDKLNALQILHRGQAGKTFYFDYSHLDCAYLSGDTSENAQDRIFNINLSPDAFLERLIIKGDAKLLRPYWEYRYVRGTKKGFFLDDSYMDYDYFWPQEAENRVYKVIYIYNKDISSQIRHNFAGYLNTKPFRIEPYNAELIVKCPGVKTHPGRSYFIGQCLPFYLADTGAQERVDKVVFALNLNRRATDKVVMNINASQEIKMSTYIKLGQYKIGEMIC